MSFVFDIVERDLLPDSVLRFGVRRLVKQRFDRSSAGGEAAQKKNVEALVEELRQSPIAIATDAANEQHYEVPAAFYQRVLGKHLKYSSGYWPEGVDTLDASEKAMLDLYFERGELEDGQSILELGCGWGSMTLQMAERLPSSQIVGVSNSASQRAFILEQARQRGLDNLEIITADMNDFSIDRRFDRVVSIEMFEHMRNYQELLSRVSTWLEPDGKLFVHIFCHRSFAYPFVATGTWDWMARHFFTGGLMPSYDLLLHFDDHLACQDRWWVDGTHYQKTSEAWLTEMDQHREPIQKLFREVYGDDQVRRWWVYWRIFFMSCAELFGFRGGDEWGVAHYRFVKR